jgi:hypothetical protein
LNERLRRIGKDRIPEHPGKLKSYVLNLSIKFYPPSAIPVAQVTRIDA